MSVSSSSASAATPDLYQRVPLGEDDANAADASNDDGEVDVHVDTAGASRTLRNFVVVSILFSANHGCVASCLALASSRLGTTGAWQSGILMITYAASSVLGATYAVKTLGARNALVAGMTGYCFYVGCFYVATHLHEHQQIVAFIGAAIGGIGAGFLWTAQGTYFGLASQEHAARLQKPVEESNAKLAGYFAFLYLTEELVMRMLSSVLLEFKLASWGAIFGIYTLIAVGSTVAMPLCVRNYPKTTTDNNNNENASVIFRKATVAAKLLRDDPKMKYMFGLNAVFGFANAFLNSYVNGEVLPIALNDPDSKYVGFLSSTIAIVAAIMSLVFGKIGSSNTSNEGNSDNNGLILMFGALCFGGVILPFVVQPDATHYGWASLLWVYSLHGTGRATFEGALRSTFADYFSYEKEGAFANIILQNGIASGIGYIMTFALTCSKPSRYCIKYGNGTLHDVWTFEFIALISVVLAIAGYLKASRLRRIELQRISIPPGGSSRNDEHHSLQRNEDGVSA